MDEAHRALEIGLIAVDRHITFGVRAHGYAEPGTRHDVLGVGRGERRGVVPSAVRDLDDALGAEGGQIDQGHAGRVIAVDEHPLPVVGPIGH